VTTKLCTKCKEIKEMSMFSKGSRNKDGKQTYCKPCCSAASMEYQKANKVARAVYMRDWKNKTKPWLSAAAKAGVRDRKVRRLLPNITPKWADLNKIRAIYRKAVDLKLQVDHIIPLRSELVCGLHCEDNLQLLTAEANQTKRNHFEAG